MVGEVGNAMSDENPYRPTSESDLRSEIEKLRQEVRATGDLSLLLGFLFAVLIVAVAALLRKAGL